MKICLIGDANSIHIRRWAGWFKDRGHEINMLSLMPLSCSLKNYDAAYGLPALSGPFAHLRRIWQIRYKVADWNPDIVHGHYLTSGGFAAAVSGCRNVIVSAWGSDVYKDARSRLKRVAVKYAIEHSNVCLGDSDHIVNAVRELCPNVDARKVIFGIDTEMFKPNPIPHAKFRFLSIRATTPTYNPRTVLEAFESLQMDAELWMFKPDAECQDLMDYVDSKPELKDKVKWIDRRPYDEMPLLYNSVDVGISIPNWDSNSTAMMECMACGVPVVASYIEQNRELIVDAHTWEDGNGFFWDDHYDYQPRDTLAKDMLRAYESQIIKDERGQRGFHARRTIQSKADWNTEMLKAEAIYEEVVG